MEIFIFLAINETSQNFKQVTIIVFFNVNIKIQMLNYVCYQNNLL